MKHEVESSFCFLLHAGFLLGLCVIPEDGGDYVPPRYLGGLSTDCTGERTLHEPQILHFSLCIPRLPYTS
jgi:hypothetical protein